MHKICVALGATLIAVLTATAVNAQQRAAPATIRVVSAPITNYTPLVVARDKGWFAGKISP